MDSAEIKWTLSHAFDEDGSRAGETPLDKLVRRIRRDQKLSNNVEESLVGIVRELDSSVQWRGLDILIGQAPFKNQTLGETIDDLIASGQVDIGAATVWPARCAFELGAALSDGTLQRLDRDDIKRVAPVERFLLIADACEAHLVEQVFQEIPAQTALTLDQASEIVRAFAREAARLKIDLNGPLSVFFDALAPEIAFPLATSLRPSIGPTYEIRARQRNNERRPGHREAPGTRLSFSTPMRGIKEVTKKTQWSYENAQQGAVV